MAGFFFAFLAVALSGWGGRDQVLMAGLAERQGARPAALVVALLTAAVTAGLAAWAAAVVAPELGSGRARLLMAGVALVLAGGEGLIAFRRRVAAEPTNSLGALGLVLFSHQITDGARFLVFALALAVAAPLAVGLGGACGAGAALALGWAEPGLVTGRRTPWVRRTIGATLLALGAALAWQALRGF